VASAFTDGGSILQNFTNRDNYELPELHVADSRNAILQVRRAHSLSTKQNDQSTSNFNGTYTFTSLSFVPGARAGAGSRAAAFADHRQRWRAEPIFGGRRRPLVGVNQFDMGLFIQDDWRLRPSMTLSLGLRYEVQTNIGDKGDWAPRVGFAWGVGKRTGSSSHAENRAFAPGSAISIAGSARPTF